MKIGISFAYFTRSTACIIVVVGIVLTRFAQNGESFRELPDWRWLVAEAVARAGRLKEVGGTMRLEAIWHWGQD